MPRKYHQGYDARLDESIGERDRGRHMKQSLKARRDESKGMAKKMSGHAFSGDKSMDKSLRHKLAAAHHKVMAEHHSKKAHKKR